MEITSVHKYISLNKMANGTTEVMFAGQPCLNTSGGSTWKINPVFAKLTYGANVLEDIPVCDETFGSDEEAIAGGLIRLHDLGAFNTEVDLPDDSYAATMTPEAFETATKQVQEECVQFAIGKTNNVMEAVLLARKLMEDMVGAKVTIKPVTKQLTLTPRYVLKNRDGSKISAHDSENDAVRSFKKLSWTKGVKIVKEDENGTEHDITDTIYESVDDDFSAWKDKVQSTHSDKKLKFITRLDDKQKTISAEEHGKDRSYGVWDHGDNKGVVFKLDESISKKEEKEIVAALKKDKKFVAKVGSDFTDKE